MRRKGRRLLAASMAALRLFCFCLAPVVLFRAAGRVPVSEGPELMGRANMPGLWQATWGVAALGHPERAVVGLRGMRGRAAGQGGL